MVRLSPTFILIAIKTAHTIIWGFFATCIIAVWVFALADDHLRSTLASGIVLIEIVVLAISGWNCPITPIAARYTFDRRANFDIYLPEWLARHNKTIFGGLYVGGIAFSLGRWIFAVVDGR